MRPIIIGLDEAGRGALAGPVVAGAVNIQTSIPLKTGQVFNIPVQDSKQLTAKQREVLAQEIKATCAWGIGVVEASEIDQIGIKKATNKAMKIALEQLLIKFQEPRTKSQTNPNNQNSKEKTRISDSGFLISGDIELWVDGRDQFTFDYPSKDFIRGDALHPVISAASILAKVHRDELMQYYCKKYQEFKFGANKGYGSAEHLALLDQEVYCELHRKTYDPLKTILTQSRLF